MDTKITGSSLPSVAAAVSSQLSFFKPSLERMVTFFEPPMAFDFFNQHIFILQLKSENIFWLIHNFRQQQEQVKENTADKLIIEFIPKAVNS